MNSREIKRLAKSLQINKDAIDHKRILTDSEAALETSGRIETAQISKSSGNRLTTLVWASGLAAAFLIISSLTVNFVLFRKNANLRNELEFVQQDIAITPTDDTVTINFYLKEHQDFIAQQASQNLDASRPVQMNIDHEDIMYYEFIDDQPEYMSPGIIVRGPSFERESNVSETPVISNGHTLTLPEARETVDFDLVSPSWLLPCYRLDQIRKIEDRDALQLLYKDGINSVSLFEQPLNGQRALEPKDFREYAVYRNTEQAGVTILAWRNSALSYVLIGNTELSQLMNMAQSINAAK
jgi:hypothetical protein